VPLKANVAKRLRSFGGAHFDHRQCIDGNMKPFLTVIIQKIRNYANKFILKEWFGFLPAPILAEF
jgi:hypothetical protein